MRHYLQELSNILSYVLARQEYPERYYHGYFRSVNIRPSRFIIEDPRTKNAIQQKKVVHVILKIKDKKGTLPEQNNKNIETLWCQEHRFYQTVLGIFRDTLRTISTLYVPYGDESVDHSKTICLHTEKDSLISAIRLDMSRCNNLEYLISDQRDLALNLNTDQLSYCDLSWCNLSQGNTLETLTKRSRNLQYLILDTCTFSRVSSDESRTFHLDLTLCNHLMELDIQWCDISLSINTSILQKCKLANIELSEGNLVESLPSSIELRWLDLRECCFFESNRLHVNKVYIDMSACRKLSHIRVKHSDVIV